MKKKCIKKREYESIIKSTVGWIYDVVLAKPFTNHISSINLNKRKRTKTIVNIIRTYTLSCYFVLFIYYITSVTSRTVFHNVKLVILNHGQHFDDLFRFNVYSLRHLWVNFWWFYWQLINLYLISQDMLNVYQII